jgi:hypothetical protein
VGLKNLNTVCFTSLKLTSRAAYIVGLLSEAGRHGFIATHPADGVYRAAFDKHFQKTIVPDMRKPTLQTAFITCRSTEKVRLTRPYTLKLIPCVYHAPPIKTTVCKRRAEYARKGVPASF